ncbi:uncharacterized protein N7446_010258 [Penicillium canescens]|uniref:Uncharacterized protein n=1 Tax=Penicillium canescens TaxID=5083 RepID=A0AAD6I7V0_PENCN|nr:uncharacterized protein N7446_010258 [Penicillium canescens]KAJ6035495.1 hypothetical protein N7460_009670 [Penicillium canescens]KAJ6037618.1 hypothetical protein N7444_010323 [Penicillium canescens]KAJ6054246.1 hypothetical protein N7446_010258 [Penicillium canescens]
MPPSAQTTRLVSTLRLLIPRLRLLQKKDNASSVVQRRELSQLLSEGREASARIRVENVIATDIAVEVMEMVELYCELLLARANVLDQLAFAEQGNRARIRAKELLKKRTQAHAGTAPTEAGKSESSGSRFGFGWLGGGAQKEAERSGTPATAAGAAEDSGDALALEEENPYMDTALDEAAVVIFYAWHRFPHELRELTMLRTMLGERYGKEFMTLAQDNKVDTVKVPDRLLKGLRVRPPGQELVELYLREIAKAYGVEWAGGEEEMNTQELGDAPPEFVDDIQGGGGDGDEAALPQTPSKQDGARTNLETRRASEASELTKATPPRGLAAGRSPVSVAPPAPRTDNPNPRVKVPGTEGKDEGVSKEGSEAATRGKSNNGIPELDELTRRFADLKRRP